MMVNKIKTIYSVNTNETSVDRTLSEFHIIYHKKIKYNMIMWEEGIK